MEPGRGETRAARRDSATGHLPGGRGCPHDGDEVPVGFHPSSHRHNGRTWTYELYKTMN